MPIRTRLLSGFAITMTLVVACESSTEINQDLFFAGFLSGAKERPTPSPSTASGQAVVVVTPSLQLSYNVTWVGLSGAPTGAHIHGPADAGSVANVLIDFASLPVGSTSQVTDYQASGSASGRLNVTPGAAITPTVSGDSLMKLLHAGLLYVNVHTPALPNGEIRTQLTKQ